MARIRQQYPQNYGSSGNINTEFENVIRYLNAAELGNSTVGELLQKIFDANGNFDGPIELRKDSAAGIQYRVGEYTDPESGWVTLATLAELRGESGQDVGEIGAPIIFGRADYTATSAQTDFDYAHETTDEILVYVDGVLQREGATHDYTTNDTGGSASAGVVTFNSGRTAGEIVSLFKIRATAITGYTRTDADTVNAQAVFPFVFDEDTKLQVYKNGILQREGGANDYTLQPANNTVTDLGSKAKLTVSSSTPVTVATGDLWHDTSVTPNQLKFYDGTQWLRTSPDSSLPTFTTSNSGQFVKVNGTGTALEYGTVDLSSVVPVTQKGAANGVASLDSSGRLPSSQLPEVLSSDSLYLNVATPSAQNYAIKRIYRQKLRVDGISIQTTSGTCTVQISFDGVGYGSTFSASSVVNESVLGTPLEIDATTVSHEIGFLVTNVSSTSQLEVTLAVSVVAS